MIKTVNGKFVVTNEKVPSKKELRAAKAAQESEGFKTLEEIQAELASTPLARIKSKLNSKEVKALPKYIKTNETILSAGWGVYDGNTVVIVLLDTRVIFIDKGMIYGETKTEISLNQITAVDTKDGLATAKIFIRFAGGVREIGTSKMIVKDFVNDLNAQIAKNNNKEITVITTPGAENKSIAQEIKELKELLDLGVITADDFETGKQNLLNK